jgi:cyclopropane fatty-acyl-phospholipid synthase-like methyltransferase
MDLKPGMRVLEIGCGWGGFAEFAAWEVGAHVTGVTISREQHDFARQTLFNAGLAERTDIQLIDYRDVRGTFDRVASIEMFEAVGKEYWPPTSTRFTTRWFRAAGPACRSSPSRTTCSTSTSLASISSRSTSSPAACCPPRPA